MRCDILGYDIYRDGTYLTSVTRSSCPDTGLNPVSNYCYAVSAYDAAGNDSAKSNQACATTLTDTPPTIPTNLVANAVTSTRIDLSWDASTGDYGVTGYKIYRDGVYLKTVPGTSASDSGLTPITDYCYTVSAYYAEGNDSATSNQACATTFPDTPPTIPTNLVANAVSPAQIELSWDASTDDYGVTGYKIYRDGTYLTSVTGTSYYDTGLNPVTNHCYAVSAYDAAGNESAKSIQVCESTPPDLTPPTEPANLALISIPPDQIALRWDPSSDDVIVAGYYIYKNGINLKSVSGTSASDTGVDKDTLLCYEVSAYDAAGNESAPSKQSCGMAWSITTIEDSHWVLRFSIVLDSADNAHISYYDGTNDYFKYTTNKSGVWVTETIDSPVNSTGLGLYNSIALDLADNVHITYHDKSISNYDLKYATNESGVWVTDTIDSQGLVGSDTSIAIDSADNIHISYHDTTNGDLKYATNVSGAWVTETIDSQGKSSTQTSITIDSADNVHISYRDGNNLKYATNVSGVWVTDTIDSRGRVGRYPSIAIDSADNVHISYHDWTNNDLKYATNVSGAWDKYIIRGEGSAYTSIAVDSSDNIHIIFGADCITSFCLKYAINR